MSKKVSKKVALAKSAVKSLNRKIARDNAAFEALSPSEKRVQIARDVLAQLKSQRLIATEGLWLATGEDGIFLEQDKVLDLKDKEVKAVLKDVKTCYGCALGGMFMCAVERANKLKVKELSDFYDPAEDDIHNEHDSSPNDIDDLGTDAFDYLKKFFSSDQLEKIECAFERGLGAHSGDSADFADEVEEPSERMRLIMENVVVNKGTFKPEKRPALTWVTPGFTV